MICTGRSPETTSFKTMAVTIYLIKNFLHRHPKEFSRTTKPFVKQKIGMQKSLKGDKVHHKYQSLSHLFFDLPIPPNCIDINWSIRIQMTYQDIELC